MRDEELWREIRSIGTALASIEIDRLLLGWHLCHGRRRRLEHRFDENQPRLPAGGPGGGRWTDGGSPGSSPVEEQGVAPDGSRILAQTSRGDEPWDERHLVTLPDGSRTLFETTGRTQTIRDGATGEVLSQSTWTANGPEPEARVQEARRPGAIPSREGSRRAPPCSAGSRREAPATAPRRSWASRPGSSGLTSRSTRSGSARSAARRWTPLARATRTCSRSRTKRRRRCERGATTPERRISGRRFTHRSKRQSMLRAIPISALRFP